MKRRQFLTGLGASAGALSVAAPATAQGLTMLRVGSCSLRNPGGPGFLGAFGQRLRELGYIEGQNLTLDYIDLQGRGDGFSNAWRQLVERKADVLVAFGPEEALKTAVAATERFPIIMAAIDFDPFALGYVKSLAPSDRQYHWYRRSSRSSSRQTTPVGDRDAFPAVVKAMVFWDAALSARSMACYARQRARNSASTSPASSLRSYPYDYAHALCASAGRSSGLFVHDDLAAFCP